MGDHRNRTDLREIQFVAVALFVELETGLTVRERVVVSRSLPPKLTDAVAVLLEAFQR
jgi:hypothetical protein